MKGPYVPIYIDDYNKKNKIYIYNKMIKGNL